MEHDTIVFTPFNPILDVTFWSTLRKLKLEKYGTQKPIIDVSGGYHVHVSGNLNIIMDDKSFETSINPCDRINGKLIIHNTSQEMNQDYMSQIEKLTKDTWDYINNESIWDNQWMLNRFVLNVYLDLKTNNFYYNFSFPVFKSPLFYVHSPPVTLTNWSINYVNVKRYIELSMQENKTDFVFIYDKVQMITEPIEHLSDNLMFDNKLIVIIDNSSIKNVMGWHLRNVIFALSCYIAIEQTIEILCYNTRQPDTSTVHTFRIKPQTIMTKLQTPQIYYGFYRLNGKIFHKYQLNRYINADEREVINFELNNKLIKWNMAPNLKLTKISKTKCLIIGAGTLGCHIARNLLGWGITHITLVDYGTVSGTNPVRQCLYDNADVGKLKVEAAVSALKNIYRFANVSGEEIMIPSPGHPVSYCKDLEDTIEKLDLLIAKHDVIFLATDSRESRWLPSLIAKTYQTLDTICITVAIGFDSYLVIRHGKTADELDVINQRMKENTHIMNPKIDPNTLDLGCYFCNDVQYPSNSTKNATLDKKCTVSRSGIAPMAAGMATELMLSCLARGDKDTDDLTSLSDIPHQIRFDLKNYRMDTLAVTPSKYCIACSDKIQSHYLNYGHTFIEKVCKNPEQLQDLVGFKDVSSDDKVITLDDTTEVISMQKENTLIEHIEEIM